MEPIITLGPFSSHRWSLFGLKGPVPKISPFPKPLVRFEPIPMEGVAPVGWWEFGMGQIEDLRAAAKRLHEVAKATESGGDRSILISRATELEVEADTIERSSVPKPPAPEAPQHVAQQQQQPQPDDSKK